MNKWFKVPSGTCLLASVALLGAPTSVAQEQDESVFEEVIVTAQRVDESIQDVPIAVTALTGEMIEDRQIINPSDLQLNAPNVAFTATNFGGSSFSIRGIGRLVIGRSAESGVSAHLNEISVPTNLNAIEFFDMERVEVLRGPQGTLFGRNATGGAINFITRKPTQDSVEGFLDAEYGAFSHRRLKGAVNLPLFRDSVALRVSAFQLDRDGYIENVAYGQTDADGNSLPGIDDDIDGRDILAYRATLAWDITDDASAWIQFSRFDEADDRARITNQVCERNVLPTSGCTADGFGWDSPNLGASTAGIFGGAAGVLPAGADGSNPGLYDYPRPESGGFRQMHTDFEPVFQESEEVWAFGVDYEFDNLSASIIGARRRSEYVAMQDYLMDVGASLGAAPFNPTGVWPVSRPSGGAGAAWVAEDCNLLAGTAGIHGGCVLPIQMNRVFAYDQADADTDYWTVEAKLHSNFEGPLNFLLGASQFEGENHGGYYVLANTLDLVGLYGSPALGAPALYPSFFLNASNPAGGNLQEGTAVFGEVYYDLSDQLKMTAGLRFNDDAKETSDTSVLFNSLDANSALGGLFGSSPIWLRPTLLLGPGGLVGLASDPTEALAPESAKLLEFWDAGSAWANNAPVAAGAVAALGIAPLVGLQLQLGLITPDQIPAVLASLGLPELFQGTVIALLSQNPAAIAADPGLAAAAGALNAIAAAVPPVPGFGETRYVTGSPSEASWQEVSGRLGFDYQLNPDTMLYGFYSRGYKPGGFNPAIPPAFQATSAFTFGSEQVNSFELGAKNILLDGRLLLNGSVFLYDYTGLQVTRIRNNSSINENIDANIFGLEVEGLWRPEAMPALSLDFSYGYLSSAVDGSQSLDPINRTGGNPDYILLNNIDPGSTTGVNYVARESQITQVVLDCALLLQCPPGVELETPAALDIRNGTTVQSVSYPANAAGVAIPAYFARSFLDAFGVETQDGIPVDLDGNQLPNAPEHTLKLGLAYTWTTGSATVTGRWDAYYQSESYAREFNTVGDTIDSWMQHNATLIYENGPWTAKAWVRNILDDDNVTGKYLTSDTSGFFRNYFLTEPQIYGVSVRMAFGD